MKPAKLTLALFAIGIGLGLSVGTANAGVTFYQPFTLLHDDNLEYVFDTGAGNVGTLGVGDRLVSVFEFHQTQGLLAGQGPTPVAPDELTGIADVTIVAVVGGSLIFGPTPGGLLSALPGGPTVTTAIWLGANSGAGSLDVIDASCGTRAACLAAASDGALWATFGFGTDPDNFWFSDPASGGGTIATVQAGPASSAFGIFSFGQSLLFNGTGVATFNNVPCAPFCGPGGDGFVTVLGNGQILGGAGLVATEWTARSKTDLQLAPIATAVPEPGSLALLGVALAGLSATRRRSAE